ncbi:hypothetical protein WICMUC_004400 [Wickerhamomyces mucosus]|uniref:Uncharacterized protein n=1 Tax=Wickerhamomyces mucosus TaxID=1378264 RepID=A0A9P8TBD8_9ASCO|nr:hypothetical protein WICMUC_004400 [Wickerhamomyces mucosus]
MYLDSVHPAVLCVYLQKAWVQGCKQQHAPTSRCLKGQHFTAETKQTTRSQGGLPRTQEGEVRQVDHWATSLSLLDQRWPRVVERGQRGHKL